MGSVEKIRIKGTWREVANSARTTIGLEDGYKEPSFSWKRKILLAEHSPIRQLALKWKWKNIKYWVSVHFTRHWLGILHFVKTSRTDRTGIDRENLLQNHLVDHECEANAQALINISRKRLCFKASPETRESWKLVIQELEKTDKAIFSVCVPECIYRGFCPEFDSCGFSCTEQYKRELEKYRNCNGE